MKHGDIKELRRFCPHPDCEKEVSHHMLCCHEHWMELPPEWRMELGVMMGNHLILDAYVMAELYWEAEEIEAEVEDNGTDNVSDV